MANDVARLYLATDFLDNYKEISSKLKKMTKNLAQEAEINLGVNIDDKEIKQALDSINTILSKKDFQQLDISNVVDEFFGKLTNSELGLEDKKKEIINFQRFLKNLSPTMVSELSHLGVEESKEAMKQIYDVFAKGGDAIFTQTGSFKKEGKWAKAEVDAIINKFSEEFNKRTRAKTLIDNIDLFPNLFGEKNFKKVEKYAEDVDEIVMQALRSFKKYENELSTSSLIDTVGFFKMYEILTEDKDFTFFKNILADEEKMSQELKNLKTEIIEILGLDQKPFVKLFEENILPEIKESYGDTYVKGTVANIEKFGKILKGERARILSGEEDFQRKIEQNNEKAQKDIIETEPEQKVNYTDAKKIKDEIDNLENLRRKVREVETALKDKTKAITDEEAQMTISINNEITKIGQLIDKVEELRTKLMEDFKIVVNANFEELNGLDIRDILENINLGNLQQASRGVHSIADMLEQIREANDLILNYASFDDRTDIIGKTNARFANKRSLTEKHVSFNAKTGEYTNPLIYDQPSRFSGELTNKLNGKKGKYNSTLHTHPEYVATPSPQDFRAFISDYVNWGIEQQYILGLEEVFEFDLNKFLKKGTTKDILNIKTLMDEALKKSEQKKYDIYNQHETNSLELFERLNKGTKANGYNWNNLKQDFKKINSSDTNKQKLENILGVNLAQKFNDEFMEFLGQQFTQNYGDSGEYLKTGSLNTNTWKKTMIGFFQDFLEKNSYKGDYNKEIADAASSLFNTQGGRLLTKIIDQTNEELKLENEGKNHQLALREMEKDIISKYFTDHKIGLKVDDVYKNYSYEDFYKAHPEFNEEINKSKTEVEINVNDDSIKQVINKIHEELKKEVFSIEVTDVIFSEEAKTNISDFIKSNSENEPITLEKIGISQETISSILETLRASLSEEPIYLNILFNNPKENTQTSILKKTDLTKPLIEKKGYTSTGKKITELNDVLNLLDSLQKTNEYSFYDKPDRIVANVGNDTEALKSKYKQYIEYYESIVQLRNILAKQKFPKEITDSIYNGIETKSLLDASIDELKDQIKEYKEEYLKLFDTKNKVEEKGQTQNQQQINNVVTNKFEQELSTLEQLRQKIVDVTTAIAQKNEAIAEEQQRMETAVNSEVENLEKLEDKIASLPAYIEIPVTITGTDNIISKENSDEYSVLTDLKEKIDKITESIDLKTASIISEQNVMENSVKIEVLALDNLQQSLEGIVNLLSKSYDLKINIPEIDLSRLTSSLDNIQENVNTGNYTGFVTPLNDILKMVQEAEKAQNNHYLKNGSKYFENNHERGFLFNTETGKYTNPFIAGEHGSIGASSMARKTANMDINNYDALWHSHPENVAALSTGDITSIFNERAFQGFNQSFIYAQAVKEIAEFSAENFIKEFNKVHNLPIDSKPSSKVIYSIIEQAMTELDNENSLLSLDDLMKDISLSQLFDKYAPYEHRFESSKKVPSGDYKKLLSHIEISPNTMSSSDDLDFVSQQLEKSDIFTIKKEIQEYWANQILASTSSFIDIFENLAQDPNYEKSNFSEIALDALKQQQQEINDIILSNPEKLIDNAIRKFEDDFLDEQISLTSKSMGTTASLNDDKDTFRVFMKAYLQDSFFKYVDDITTQDLDELLFKTYNGGSYESIGNDAFQLNYRNNMQAFLRDKGYDVDKFYKVYTLDDFFAQNPQLTRPPITGVQSSTQESAEGLDKENQSFKDVALSAMTASQAKEAFVEANKEVKASVEGSIDNIENEGKAFSSIDENTVSNIERITTAIEELNSMLEALNKLMRSVFSNQGQMGWDINENGILNLSKALNSIRSASTGNYYGGSTSNYYGIEEDQLRDLLDQYTRSLQDAISGFSGLNNVDFNNLIIALSEIYELLEKITENLNSGISTTQFDLLAEKIATYNPQIQAYNDKLEKAKKLTEEIAQIEGQWDSFYGDESWKDTSKVKPSTSILLEDSKSMGYEGLGQDLYSFIDSQIDSSNSIKKQKEQIENAKKVGNELVNLYNEYSKLSFKKIKNGGFLDSFDSQKLAEASQRIQDLKKQLLDLRNSLKPSDRTDIDNILKGVDEYERKTKSSRAASLYDMLINSEGDIQKLLAKRAYTTNADVGNTSGLTVNEQNELLRLTEKRKQIQDEINKLISEQGVKTQAVKQKEAELLQTRRSFENTLNQSWQNKLGDELQKPYDAISDLEYKSGDARYVQSDAFDERISNLKKQADALRDSLKSLSYNDKDGIAKYNEQFLDLQRNISKAKDELKQLESKDVSKLMRNIAQFMERNSSISLQAKNELEAFYNELNNGSRMSKERLVEIANGFTRIQAEESKAGRTGMTFFDLISLRGKALIAQLATFTSVYDFIRYFKEGMQIVIQFDDALAEMQKVSSESLETLREFQTESFDLADNIGSDALALQQSVAEFMRLGQSLQEATDSAMSANILLNVSEFTNASEASEALIAMSQAYQDLSNIEIIDVINKLGNDFPISTQGLATALQDGAASLTTAGNSFYEAAALVTAGIFYA